VGVLCCLGSDDRCCDIYDVLFQKEDVVLTDHNICHPWRILF